jgi:hypothetical protein
MVLHGPSPESGEVIWGMSDYQFLVTGRLNEVRIAVCG